MTLKFRKNIILYVLLSFSLVACKATKNKTEVADKPNIVLIMADDLGIGDIGVYGQDIFFTPNIDRLAREGMQFNNFYSGSTVCAPSRAALFTGQHTGHTKVRGNGEFPLDSSKRIIPEMLKEGGYTNAMFGKWGLGLKGSTGSPEKRGWDAFIGHLHHVDAHFQRPDSLDVIQNGKMTKLNTPEGSYANEIFTEAAVDFIESSSHDKPFFLYLSLTIPHAELVVPHKFISNHMLSDNVSKYEPEKAWPEGRHYGAQKHPKAAYAALVESIDNYVGQIMTALKKKGYDNNTIVIFTSDNGTHLEGGRIMEDVDFFESSGPYRGVKRDLFEGGIRTPFIVRWPGEIASGSTSGFQGAFWDLYPTFAEVSGLNQEFPAVDGISFLPTLRDSKKQKKHEYLYWEFHESGGKQAILKDEWKAIRLQINTVDPHVELYNIALDPQEKNNIAAQYPDITKNLIHMMDSIRTHNQNFSFLKNQSQKHQ
ncbi:arylsulfatase [Gramella jeungdoensis]|nr:arylsulfatase [Gramella jeungdoensis]